MSLLATDFDFNLPEELIAKFPAEKRNLSRLLYFTGKNEEVADKKFEDIIDLLPDNAVLVRNNTQVIPARCYARRVTGGKLEVLVERLLSNNRCLAHIRSNRTLKIGDLVLLNLEEERLANPDIFPLLDQLINSYLAGKDFTLGQVEQLAKEKNFTLAQEKFLKNRYALYQALDKGKRSLKAEAFYAQEREKSFAFQVVGRQANLYKIALVQLATSSTLSKEELSNPENSNEALACTSATNADSILDLLHIVGHMPLPPYMGRKDLDSDQQRYQTVYAKEPGAVAAPTAGLHFTPEILESIRKKNIDILEVTLHVGAGTFMPLKTDNVEQHIMHAEWIDVNQEVVDQLNKALIAKRPIVAVGTTSVRALESVAQYSLEQYLITKAEESSANSTEYKDILKKIYVSRIKEMLIAVGEADMLNFYQGIYNILENEAHQPEFRIQRFDPVRLHTNVHSDASMIELAELIQTLGQEGFSFKNLDFLGKDKDFLYSLMRLTHKYLASPYLEGMIRIIKGYDKVFNTYELIKGKVSMMADPKRAFSSFYMNTSLEFGKEVPLQPLTSDTAIFIHPGRKVHLVDHLITNFHLPKSTLIMLVSAFVGRDYCINAYQHAIDEKYRFYSYGDSCLMPNLMKDKDFDYLI